MPPRTTLKKKTVDAKRVAQKPKGGTRRKPPAKVTYGETDKFLHELELWGISLRAEVETLENLVHGFPTAEPVPAAVKQELGKLAEVIADHPKCSPVPKWDRWR